MRAPIIEKNIRDGKTSLTNWGSIPLDFANFFEIDIPIKSAKAIKNPYHLILNNPTFKISGPGDFRKAGYENIYQIN
tara:strand:+ start:8906 stop:9136 length:231 start_codon:yes stop_codon:yes gene_type:complete